MGKLTKEEEVLLSNYSSSTSTGNSVMFYINAAVVSLAPIYLFYGVHQMEIADSWIVWAISSSASIYLLSLACSNQKRLLKHSIMMKRGTAVDREINQIYGNDKKMSTKEREERALYRKNEVADAEATYLSIFFTNVLYLALLLLFSFFLLANFAPLFNGAVRICAMKDLETLGFAQFWKRKRKDLLKKALRVMDLLKKDLRAKDLEIKAL